ncbi:MAG: uroporphyrinogen decarboxylase family protein [Capsulimonadaceae bacterium]
MTPRERMKAAVDGRSIDRVPYVAWHHFHLDPPAGPESGMADAEIRFYESFQPDLLKVMHDIRYESIGELARPEDWRSIPVLEPGSGNFGLQLHTLGQIRAALDPMVPMIDTVFGVYYYGDKLSGGRLLTHLRDDPDSVHVGLAALAESLRCYARATLDDGGCEGIYFALSGASGEGATREEYIAHFKQYDQSVLESVLDAPFNILHLHGYKDLYFDLTHDLPAAIVCWSDRAGGPTLTEARRIHAGCIMGGIDETQFEKMTPDEIVAQSRAAIAEAGTQHFVLAPGCSVPDNASVPRLQAIRAAVS